jgi:hypothetical protein
MVIVHLDGVGAEIFPDGFPEGKNFRLKVGSINVFNGGARRSLGRRRPELGLYVARRALGRAYRSSCSWSRSQEAQRQ